MKLVSVLILLFAFQLNVINLVAQEFQSNYRVTDSQQFGKLNPEAPPQTADFAEMIGSCECQSIRRNPDQSWQDTMKMVWDFKYILNGTAVQDEVWSEDARYASSIRQYHPDSARWVVTYFAYPGVTTSPGVWQGNRKDGQILLKQPQQAPNGMDGFSQLTFYDINEDGFNWKGEWIDTSKTFIYPFWMIYCKKIL